METETITREQWLRSAFAALRPSVLGAHLSLPETVHLSVGFPSTRALSAKRRAIGQCWLKHTSADGVPHIFISPLLADAPRALDVLLHEMIHASGIAGHGPDFRRPALRLGLTGKMTATVADPELTERLNALVATLGAYPHSALTGHGPIPKQGTRLLKAACQCGAVIRVTQKLVDDPGLPQCACGGRFELA